MTADERFALEHQTQAWLRGIRVAWVKKYGPDCPVRPWEEISAADRVILMAGLVAAIKAGAPDALAAARKRRDEAMIAASLNAPA